MALFKKQKQLLIQKEHNKYKDSRKYGNPAVFFIYNWCTREESNPRKHALGGRCSILLSYGCILMTRLILQYKSILVNKINCYILYFSIPSTMSIILSSQSPLNDSISPVSQAELSLGSIGILDTLLILYFLAISSM